MYNMYSLNVRSQNGRKFAYLVKRRKRSGGAGSEFMTWYLGPVNEETLAGLVETTSGLMAQMSRNEEDPRRMRCPICNTPVSRLGIEDVVAERLTERLKDMEKRDEDIYNSEEYATLRLVVNALRDPNRTNLSDDTTH